MATTPSKEAVREANIHIQKLFQQLSDQEKRFNELLQTKEQEKQALIAHIEGSLMRDNDMNHNSHDDDDDNI